MKVLWPVCTRYYSQSYIFFLLIAVWLMMSSTPGLAQEVPESPRPITIPLQPPRPPQEQILSPVPQQFDWISRESPFNPLLESLVELQRTPSSLFMSLTAAEQYSDNFQRTDVDPEENFGTSLILGTVYRRERARRFLSLAGTMGVRYDTADQRGEGSINLTLNTGYELSRLALALSDSLTVSDDRFSLSQGIESRRSSFLRNAFSPQMRVALSRLTSMTVGYRNTVTVAPAVTPIPDEECLLRLLQDKPCDTMSRKPQHNAN